MKRRNLVAARSKLMRKGGVHERSRGSKRRKAAASLRSEIEQALADRYDDGRGLASPTALPV
ncbi:hypothetical protein [Arhodomonas sp. AD133]|uniref:hypothetical protein n=1 Tax=Arhodomonas sp. AD133 TaxID=3415009 RepID=UPI003EBF708B